MKINSFLLFPVIFLSLLTTDVFAAPIVGRFYPLSPSPQEKAANVIKEGMVESAQTGAFWAAYYAKKAEERAITRKVEQVRGYILAMFQGYQRENHTGFIKIIENSPDISYSLKNGLINNFNEYRNARDFTDDLYRKEYFKWARKIADSHEASFIELIVLLEYMNPREDKKNLRLEIKKLDLEKEIREELEKFVSNYYEVRKKIDVPYSERENALIAATLG